MPTILIAADDPNLTKMLRRMLAHEGYGVRIAATGWEALAQAEAYRPDLIALTTVTVTADARGQDVAIGVRDYYGLPRSVLLRTEQEPRDGGGANAAKNMPKNLLYAVFRPASAPWSGVNCVRTHAPRASPSR